MPFKSDQTMWQLSFSLSDEEEAARISRYVHLDEFCFERVPLFSPRSMDSQQLMDEALRRCQGWHDPVIGLIKDTPVEEVWGTELFDRLPVNTSFHSQTRASSLSPFITLVGDAAHPMSPFKGQGANQVHRFVDLKAANLQLRRH